MLAFRRIMLRKAVQAGNTPAVSALLRAGAPPNGPTGPGDTHSMLHAAAWRGGDVVDVLLAGGAFPNVTNRAGLTPLHLAVRQGRLQAVASLLRAGADPRAPDSQGRTALELAARDGTPSPCQVESVERPSSPPLANRCTGSLLALLRTLPAPRPGCGELCEPRFWKAATRHDVRTALARAPATTQWSAPDGGPLHLAVAAGANVEMLELLLDHGIDPNGRDRRDDTPLHVAAGQPGGADSVALLLRRGAALEPLNGKDQTPLHTAAERAATLDAMRVLLDAGADPDAYAPALYDKTPRDLAVSQPDGPAAAKLILSYPGTFGRSQPDLAQLLLRVAAERGHPATVELLLDRGADVDYFTSFVTSPLSTAARSGNLGAMRVLLRHGADPNSRWFGLTYSPRQGERPLHAAIRHPAAVELLLAGGADPNGRANWLETPLHIAAQECAGASLRLLLEHGAEPDIRDHDGDTPAPPRSVAR